jgi:hypothetical protein
MCSARLGVEARADAYSSALSRSFNSSATVCQSRDGWSSKCVRHRAPSGVLHEHGLFLWRCRAVFGLYSFQRANGGEIGLGFLLQAAFADGVSAGYAEIAGKGWCGSRVAGSNDSWGWSSSSGRNAHSLVAISHANW